MEIHFFLSWELDGGGVELHPPPGLFPIEGTPVPVDWECGWTPETVWTVLEKGKSHAPTGLRAPDCRPVASRCTDSQ